MPKKCYSCVHIDNWLEYGQYLVDCKLGCMSERNMHNNLVICCHYKEHPYIEELVDLMGADKPIVENFINDMIEEV